MDGWTGWCVCTHMCMLVSTILTISIRAIRVHYFCFTLFFPIPPSLFSSFYPSLTLSLSHPSLSHPLPYSEPHLSIAVEEFERRLRTIESSNVFNNWSIEDRIRCVCLCVYVFVCIKVYMYVCVSILQQAMKLQYIHFQTNHIIQINC